MLKPVIEYFEKTKVILIIYIVLILLFILLPINNKDSKINTFTFLKVRLDYILHAFLFMPWMLLKPNKSIKRYVWFMIGIGLAVLTECLQYPLPYRSFNLNDLVFNMLGIIVGTLIIFLHLYNKNPKSIAK